MWHALVYYPKLNHAGLNRFREKYDPSFPAYEEHMPFLFPVPDSIDPGRLAQHLDTILRSWKPFQVHFIGLIKSWDHWLLLGVREGAENVKKLHLEIYSDVLDPFHRKDLPFDPHIGLGLFASEDFDPFNPAKTELKEIAYMNAIAEADSQKFDFWCEVNKLDLIRGDDMLTKPITIRKYKLTK